MQKIHHFLKVLKSAFLSEFLPLGVPHSKVFDALVQIAYECRKRNKILIDKEVVLQYFNTDALRRILRHEGFPFLLEERHGFSFLHLSILEFFAGRHLCNCLFNRTSPAGRAEAATFVSNNKYKAIHRLTFSFMMQEASPNGMPALIALFSIVDQTPIDVIGVQHILLKARLLEAFLSATEDVNPPREHSQCIELVDKLAVLPFTLRKERRLYQSALRWILQLPNTIRVFPRIAAIVLRNLELLDKKDRRRIEVSENPIELSNPVLISFLNNYETKLLRESSQSISTSTSSDDFGGDAFDDYLNVCINEMENERTDEDFLSLEMQLACVVAKQVSRAADCVCRILKALSENAFHKNIMQMAFKCITDNLDVFYKEKHDVLAILESWWTNDGDFLRIEAIRGFLKVIETFPEGSSDAFGMLSALCCDAKPPVRRKALEYLSDAVKELPEKASEAFDILSSKWEDPDEDVKAIVIESIAKIAKTQPGMSTRALEILFVWSQNIKWEVRKAIIKSIPHILRMMPIKAPYIFRILVSKCDDVNRFVRKEAVEQIPNVVQALPGNVSEALSILTVMGADEDEDIRQVVVTSVSRIVKMYEETASDALNIILPRTEDPVPSVREEVVLSIAAMMTAMPEQIPQVFQVFLMTSHDVDARVRKSAAISVTSMARRFPNTAPDGFRILISKCDDSDILVRKAAIQGIASLCKILRENVSAAFEMVSQMCEDSNESIRIQAVECISIILDAFPEKASSAFEILQLRCQDHADDVRSQAVLGLSKIAILLPENANQICSFLFEMIENSASTSVVAIAAIKSVSNLIKMLPQRAFESLEIFSSQCLHRDWAIRQELLEQILNLSCISVYRFRDMIKSMRRLVLCDDPSLRSDSQSILDRSSLEFGIDVSLRYPFEYEAIFSSIALRLIKKILCISDSNDGGRKLVLFDACDEKEWSESFPKIQKFTSHLRQVLSQKCFLLSFCLPEFFASEIRHH